MWNLLLGSMLVGGTPVLYDGSPGYPDLDVLWEMAAAAGVTLFGTSAAFLAACMKAGHPAGCGARPVAAAGDRVDRLAARGRGLRLGLRRGQARRLARLAERRHRCRAARSSAACRRCRSTPASSRRASLGRPGRGVRRGRPVGRRPDRRAGADRAAAVDAALLLERPGRDALPRELFRDVSRGLAPRRLDPDHRARQRGHRGPLGFDAQPAGHPLRDERAVRRGRRACRRSATASSSGWSCPTARYWMPLFVVLADGVELDDALVTPDPDDDPRGALAAPRPGRDHRGAGRPAHADRQEDGGPGQAALPGPAARRGRGAGRDGRSGRARMVRQIRRGTGRRGGVAGILPRWTHRPASVSSSRSTVPDRRARAASGPPPRSRSATASATRACSIAR